MKAHVYPLWRRSSRSHTALESCYVPITTHTGIVTYPPLVKKKSNNKISLWNLCSFINLLTDNLVIHEIWFLTPSFAAMALYKMAKTAPWCDTGLWRSLFLPGHFGTFPSLVVVRLCCLSWSTSFQISSLANHWNPGLLLFSLDMISREVTSKTATC